MACDCFVNQQSHPTPCWHQSIDESCPSKCSNVDYSWALIFREQGIVLLYWSSETAFVYVDYQTSSMQLCNQFASENGLLVYWGRWTCSYISVTTSLVTISNSFFRKLLIQCCLISLSSAVSTCPLNTFNGFWSWRWID